MKKGKIILDFTDFGNREWKDHLKGGNADNKTPDDFNPDDVIIGTKVEREHTSNSDIAAEIAIDHLAQDDEYYDKLIASGIADEEDAIATFDELKGKNARKKAEEDIDDFIDTNIEEEEDEDVEEDELGTDKVDFENDEQIFDEEEPKNKIKIMEKSVLKKYKSFLIKEEVEPVKEQAPPPPAEPAPNRQYSKENKYKSQMPYDKKVVDKLNDYNFIYYVPEGEKLDSQPKKGTHFIIIDILNLTYSIVDRESPDIRAIEPSKLKHILENL